jgi:hypothetical protein
MAKKKLPSIHPGEILEDTDGYAFPRGSMGTRKILVSLF